MKWTRPDANNGSWNSSCKFLGTVVSADTDGLFRKLGNDKVVEEEIVYEGRDSRQDSRQQDTRQQDHRQQDPRDRRDPRDAPPLRKKVPPSRPL